MRVCLITPGHLATNPRLVKEARALRKAGYEVSIVCGRYSDWGITQDELLAREFKNVLPVGFGPVGASRFRYIRQTLVRRAARGGASLLGVPDALVEWALHPAVWDLKVAAQKVRADLYVAHYVAALPAAASAARRHGARFAFDAEDFHDGDLADIPQNRLDIALTKAVQRRYLRDASYITAAAPLIAKAYAESYDILEPSVILNVFERAKAPVRASTGGTALPSPSLYWFSQTIGPDRGLEAAIDAIALADSRPNLHLREIPASGYAEKLLMRARSLGIESRIVFHDPVPPDQVEQVGAEYDVGYVGELGQTTNRSLALTNKLFSYLLSGIPIIATDIPAHRALSNALGDAMILFEPGNIPSLGRALDKLLSPPTLASARRVAFDLGSSRFNWEAESTKYLRIVSSVMEPR